MVQTRQHLSGFSVIELLVVISLISMFTAGSLILFRSSARIAKLDAAVDDARETFRITRQQSVAEVNGSAFGVHINSSQFVIFEGNEYSIESGTNRAVKIHDDIEIANVSLEGGGRDVMFDRVNGTTSQYGTFDIRVVAYPNESRTLRVDSSGMISVEQ
jgi:prepilin-type N-terminal cleavage/methylation domain-containing protein